MARCKNSALPVVTSFIFTIVTIDGAVLTENIFSWPGMVNLY